MGNQMEGAVAAGNNIEVEKKARLDAHLADLKASGLRGLEGRIQRGLDPAGMLA